MLLLFLFLSDDGIVENAALQSPQPVIDDQHGIRIVVDTVNEFAPVFSLRREAGLLVLVRLRLIVQSVVE